jgi:metal-dependent hydrolase (beta-lactamase superfamily II)
VAKATIRLGVESEAIDLCILTHRHRDHVGRLRALNETCSFEVASHRAKAETIEKATGVSVDNKLEALDFNAIYSSHGEDIPEGEKEKLSELLRSFKNV